MTQHPTNTNVTDDKTKYSEGSNVHMTQKSLLLVYTAANICITYIN